MLTLPTSMDSFLPQCALPPANPISPLISNSYITCNANSSHLLLDLAEPFYSTSFPYPLDLSSSAPSSKKRKSAHQYLYGDQYTASHASSTHNCDDLEDVLNFLWMEDDDAASAAQSEASLNHEASSSEQFPALLRELDWEHCSNESSCYIAESRGYNEALKLEGGGDDHNQSSMAEEEELYLINGAAEPSPSYNGAGKGGWQKRSTSVREGGAGGGEYMTEMKDSGSSSRSCWLQNEEGKRGMSSSSWWLQEGACRAMNYQRGNWQDGIRASWQAGGGGARASWQGGGGGIMKSSWQEKQTAVRASWQQAPAASAAGLPLSAYNDGTINSDQQQRAGGSSSSGGSWAGPTLLDIESALNNSNGSGSPTPSSNSTPAINHAITATPPFLTDVKAILLSHQQDSCLPSMSDSSSSWRLKLQKRSSQEPKYSIKVESEEKALGDGYRWRKYGQKSIKNSPFPRSYYRCSTGKCNAKKQVEKCQDEDGFFLVTYEGIHLHHKPNLLTKLRMAGDAGEDEKQKLIQSEKQKSPSSPSSSTSLCQSIPLSD